MSLHLREAWALRIEAESSDLLRADDYQDQASRDKNLYRDFKDAVDECFFCGRGLTQKAIDNGWWVHLHSGGYIFPSDPKYFDSDDSQGAFPVGSECAKKIPVTHRFRQGKQGALYVYEIDYAGDKDSLKAGNLTEYTSTVTIEADSELEARLVAEQMVATHGEPTAVRRIEARHVTAVRATDEEWAKATKAARAKIRNAPAPSEADRIHHDQMVKRQSGSREGGDGRGNNIDRHRRAQKMLSEFGDGKHCPCLGCRTRLDIHTITADRIHPGHTGGSYRYPNVVPSCERCNAARPDVKMTEHDIGSRDPQAHRQRAASI